MADLDNTPADETSTKPPGFNDRKDRLGEAYRGKRAYKTLPYELMLKLGNSPFSDNIGEILANPDFQSRILEPFNRAKLADRWPNRELALIAFLNLLATPLELFDSPINWPENRKQLSSFPTQAAKAKKQIAALPVDALKAKADTLTGFARTGNFLSIEGLIERLNNDLDLLSRIAAATEPEKSPIIVTKKEAKRSRETQHAKLLKRELPKYLHGKNYELIAEAIRIVHCSDKFLEPDDIRKA